MPKASFEGSATSSGLAPSPKQSSVKSPPTDAAINARKPSLREQPDYLKEVAEALNRREDLIRIKARLSSDRDLLTMDPALKPWLFRRSLSTNFSESFVRGDESFMRGEESFVRGEENFVRGVESFSRGLESFGRGDRTRNLSRGTSSSDSSFPGDDEE